LLKTFGFVHEIVEPPPGPQPVSDLQFFPWASQVTATVLVESLAEAEPAESTRLTPMANANPTKVSFFMVSSLHDAGQPK
jgi:hypothetical protein